MCKQGRLILENNSKLVMTGDSITDCDRARPVGEGLFQALGNGYPSVLSAMLKNLDPTTSIRIVNMGVSGSTSRDLASSWDEQVLSLKPDWISIMIGINDVWRQFDSRNMTECHVYLDEYERNLEHVILKSIKSVKGLILMTPYFIESNRSDKMRIMMDQYGSVVKKLSDKYNAIFVDVQNVFDDLLMYCHSSEIAWDRVHPGLDGHMAIAMALIKAMQV